MREGDHIKVYTLGKRKLEGTILEVHDQYVVLKDDFNGKTYQIQMTSINDIELGKEGSNDGRDTAISRTHSQQC